MSHNEKLPIPKDRETGYNQFAFINTFARKGEVSEMKKMVEHFSERITPLVFHMAMEQSLAHAQLGSIEFLMNYVDIVSEHYLLCFIDNGELTGNHLCIMEMLYDKKPEFLEQSRELNKLGKYKALEEIINFIDVVKVRAKINDGIPLRQDDAGAMGERAIKI